MIDAQDRSDTIATQGLSASEVAARRTRGEGNVVALRSSRSYGQIVRENVFTFVNNVLYILGIALVALGRVTDALASVGVVLLNVLVSVVQEVRAKRTLDRIALLTRPRVTVLRSGREQQIDPTEVVRGDILIVRPGGQIVVDGPLVGDGHIDVDESLLTGESDLIPKRAGDPLYSGSFCVAGGALYRADTVGAESVAHKITVSARARRQSYQRGYPAGVRRATPARPGGGALFVGPQVERAAVRRRGVARRLCPGREEMPGRRHGRTGEQHTGLSRRARLS